MVVGRPFKPGQSGNPKGVPKARVIGSPSQCWRTCVQTSRPAGPQRSRRPGPRTRSGTSASCVAPALAFLQRRFKRNRHEALTSPSRDSPAIQPGMS